jgi:hypothetical protein
MLYRRDPLLLSFHFTQLVERFCATAGFPIAPACHAPLGEHLDGL